MEESNPPALSAYYFQDKDDEVIRKSLKKDLTAAGAIKTSFSIVPEETWSESWKQFFKTRKVGKGFWIVPTWEKSPKIANDERSIHLDPGQAFGTGDHPTTRLCISMLEEAIDGGEIVADIGAGSGILTIAAGMLGAGKIYATEVEPAAHKACRENLARNKIVADVRLTDSLPSDFPPCDVVVSNIVSAVLIRLAPEIFRLCKSCGIWIISGVIPENFSDVLSASTKAGFLLVTSRQDEGWVGAVLRKP